MNVQGQEETLLKGHSFEDKELWFSNRNSEPKVDVVMLTKDSEYVLKKCLDSLYQSVPVNRLIIVDGGSKDKTLSILKKYPHVEIVPEKLTCRGAARQIGIEKVKTDWFMFIDSDVVLCKDWFQKASNGNLLSQKNVGAIWGVDIPSGVNPSSTIGRLFKTIERRVFEIRGSCHDILIRRDVVKGIKIPPQMHTMEDQYIKNWIKSKNYEIIVNYDAYCTHYKLLDVLFSISNLTATVREFGKMKFMRERMAYALLFAAVWFRYRIGSRHEKQD